MFLVRFLLVAFLFSETFYSKRSSEDDSISQTIVYTQLAIYVTGFSNDERQSNNQMASGFQPAIAVVFIKSQVMKLTAHMLTL